MKINSSVHHFDHQARNQSAKRGVVKNKPPHETNTEKPLTPEKPLENGELKRPGVIRHLQKGHFQGVPEVRLRSIFQAQLNAIHQQYNTDLINQTGGNLADAVNGVYQSATQANQLDERQTAVLSEAINVFESSLKEALSDTSDPQGTVSSLQSSVESFLSTVNQLATAFDADATLATDDVSLDKREISPKGTVPAEFDAGIPAHQEDGKKTFLADLAERFSSVIEPILNELRTSLSQNSFEPTAPNNNGAAFAKFLSIYRENSAT